jgi:hypothetical protein
MISNVIPTNPVVSGSVSLAEFFREGVPAMVGATLLKDKASVFRRLSKEHLSYQFGWLPLVSDIKSAAKAVMESEKILKQLARDSGKRVHRRTHLQPEIWDSEVTTGSFYPSGIGPWAISSYPVVDWSDTKRRSSSFSGCFIYHFDPGDMSNLSRIATEARLLYGLELTPETLWNLAPWSWLVDWMANVGPLLHNVSAFQNDGLVMHYGYEMDHVQRVIARRISNIVPRAGNYLPSGVSVTLNMDRKTRRKATPFGFGLLDSQFTVRQWSILAALGITRAPRSLI